jgi:DNA-binding Xre family transcriptional regulator
MIEIKIAEKAKSRGLETAFSLQKALNISPTIASRLWKGNFNKIGVGTMDKLCTFFKCQPNDLFFFTGETVTQSGNRPVTQLSKNDVIELSNMGEKLLSTIEIAETLGLSRKRVNDYINVGELKATKGKGGHNFVVESDFEAFRNKRIAENT